MRPVATTLWSLIEECSSFFSHMLIDFQPASLIRRKRNLKRRVFWCMGRSLKGNSEEEKKLGESRKEKSRR
jgi:hypothetical protein